MAGSSGVDGASERIRIALADDHPLIRSGLRRVLDLEADLAVVGEAATSRRHWRSRRRISRGWSYPI